MEIDDGDEYHFIVSFIKDKPKTDTYGYIGGTDEGHEGRWVFQHSGTPVTFFKWHSGEPNGGSSFNYLGLHYRDLDMGDIYIYMMRLG